MSRDPISPEDVFAEAVSLPADDRVAFIERQCGEGTDQANDLIQLVRSHEKNVRNDAFILDKPPINTLQNLPAVAEIAEKAGDEIGRYKLLEKIGEGGMGVVYMAEQIEGVHRRVALKIIKLGMDTRQVIARFEAERQAMALFDHPHITKVLDAGSTTVGRPYFVMELVKGTSITQYVRSNRLSMDQRLELFINVCGAVQHAHQKGIIHRDLKPSNILVTMHDGVPVPKVIDFGIAKAIGQHRLTEKTLFTRYSAMVGTPQYMSPEQAELNGLDVDTRSDIYSLGVLLYELVTGTTPLCSEQLKKVNPIELHETIRDAEIETPSSRIQHVQNEAVAQVIDPMPRRRSFGELDWIVMKALSRARTQRYASANELAADVERYRQGEPVLAAPPSRFRKLGAFVRRNLKPLILTATVSLLLLGFSIACMTLAVQVSRTNKKLEETNGRLTENIQQLEIAEEQVREAARTQKLDAAISVAIVKFEMDFTPRIYELAEQLFPDFFQEFGESGPVSTEVAELLELDEQPLADSDDPESFEFCFDYDRPKLLELGEFEFLDRSLEPIRRHLEKSETMIHRIFDMPGERMDPHDNEEHEHTPECLKLRGKANLLLGSFRYLFYRHLVAEYRNSFGENDPNVAEALNLLAASLIQKKEYTQAESHLREALAIGEAENQKVSRILLERVRNRDR